MYTKIKLNHLYNNKDKLLKYSNMTVYDIKSIWKSLFDVDIIDCENIEYHYDLPLYAKMIKRYQNNNNSPVRLHRQIDPCNQRIVRDRYDLSYDLLDFFAWIEDSLGSYRLLEFGSQEYVDRWRQSSIQFFFWIDKEKQLSLIDEYNINIKKWNLLID